MTFVNFNYKPTYNIPNSWQGLIYYMGRLYDSLPEEYKKIIDESIGTLKKEYQNIVMRCYKEGAVTEKIAFSYNVSVRSILPHLKEFYREVYKRLRK